MIISQPYIYENPPTIDEPNHIRMWSAAIMRDFLSAVRKGASHWFSSQDLPPGGSGPYSASYLTTPTLKRHTIYAPVDMQEGDKLPIIVWANGLGMAWGLMFSVFLREIASYGYIVVANGDPKGWATLRRVNDKAILEAVEWASSAPMGPTDIRSHVDANCIALAGQSKGGLHTYKAAKMLRTDERVKTLGLFNSGLLYPKKKEFDMVTGLKTPVFYFIGGKADVAFEWSEKDWDRVPKELVSWYGNLDVGHIGTFYEENGGRFGRAAVDWLDAMLKGEGRAKRALLEYDQKGWHVRKRNL